MDHLVNAEILARDLDVGALSTLVVTEATRMRERTIIKGWISAKPEGPGGNIRTRLKCMFSA